MLRECTGGGSWVPFPPHHRCLLLGFGKARSESGGVWKRSGPALSTLPQLATQVSCQCPPWQCSLMQTSTIQRKPGRRDSQSHGLPPPGIVMGNPIGGGTNLRVQHKYNLQSAEIWALKSAANSGFKAKERF